MLTDIYGSDVALTDQAALAHWNGVQQGVLSHGASAADHLAATLEAEPGFGLGHALKGLFLMMLGRRELVAVAADSLATARACGTSTPREAAYVEALAAWLADQPEKAATIAESILVSHPHDALAMKLSHGIRFILGHRRAMLDTLDVLRPAYDPSHPAFGYYMGCRAFALEENGAYDCARAAGMTALDHASDDAWGLHAVAHVHDMTGNATAGLEWLSGNESAWAHCNNFRFHVWWHKALMYLDLGQTDAALALYDTHVRAEKSDDYRDIANATSLLMRLELDGVHVGKRWEELADLAEKRTEDGCLIFADLHYLLALVGDNRPAAAHTLVQRIARDGAATPTDMNARFENPGTAAAQGLEAFGEGNFEAAFARLNAARPAMQLAGGSHAQRDVFERITIDAGIRAGQFDHAATLLANRTASRGGHEDGFAARRLEMIYSTTRRAAAISAE
ncbi:tetratricopeptide repeat protein [Rhodobacteraceae bacterium SC52]|nr:tetratricopeptide repeat protein [Rhodobacteraceae bacterium SC52]